MRCTGVAVVKETYEIDEQVFANLQDVAHAYSISYGKLSGRLRKCIPLYDAIYGDRWTWDSIPYKGRIYTSTAELSDATGVDEAVIVKRLNQGWLVWRVIHTPTYRIDGKQYSILADVAEAYGLIYATMMSRMFKGNCTLYDAVHFGEPVIYGGRKYLDRAALCDTVGISLQKLDQMLNDGMKLTRAVNLLVIEATKRKEIDRKWALELKQRIEKNKLLRAERDRSRQRLTDIIYFHLGNAQAKQAVHISALCTVLNQRLAMVKAGQRPQIVRLTTVIQRHIDRIMEHRAREQRWRLREEVREHIHCNDAGAYTPIYPWLVSRLIDRTDEDRLYDAVTYRVNRGWPILRAVETPLEWD